MLVHDKVRERTPMDDNGGGRMTHAAPTVVPRAAPSSSLLKAGRLLTAIGLLALLFLGYEFLASGLTEDRSQVALQTAFKRAIPTTTLGAPTAQPAEGSPVALLDIPRLGLHEVVVEGTTPTDLKAGPGHLRTSPLPGEFGNSVLAARRTTYGGPFRDLDRLRPGDAMIVTTGQGTFVYVVSATGRVSAGQAEPFVGTPDSRLTLVTSAPPYLASQRLVVVSTLVGTPGDVANRPPAPIAAADLGLASNPLGLWPALIWVQLLGLAAWLAWRMRARLPRTVLFMFAVPVMTALAVLTFSSFDAILPGLL